MFGPRTRLQHVWMVMLRRNTAFMTQILDGVTSLSEFAWLHMHRRLHAVFISIERAVLHKDLSLP